MCEDTQAFSSVSTGDPARAEELYRRTLGLRVADTAAGLGLRLAGGTRVSVDPSSDRRASDHAVLSSVVDDFAAAIAWFKDPAGHLLSVLQEEDRPSARARAA